MLICTQGTQSLISARAHDPRWHAHPGSDSTLKPCPEFPLRWSQEREKELMASSFTATGRSLSICPSQKTPLFPADRGRRERAKELPCPAVGQRLGRWVLDCCLKPHGGEGGRQRASMCNSQPAVGVLPQLSSSVWKTPQHDIKYSPNCQEVQPT